MNKEKTDFESEHLQKRPKTAHFDDHVPVYIPPSKLYKYDPRLEDKRKDAIEEFTSSKNTFIATIIVGAAVIILGIILTWVAAHYELKDFFIIGPGALIIGFVMILIGVILLVKGICATKHANLTVRSSNVKQTKNIATRPIMHPDHSFITTSEISIHGVQSRVTSPDADHLYGASQRISPESTIINSEDDPLHFNNNNNLYNSTESTASPKAKVVKHREQHNHKNKTGHKHVIEDKSDEEVNAANNQVYQISIPSENGYINDGYDNSKMSSIPVPAIYVEPGLNEVTFF